MVAIRVSNSLNVLRAARTRAPQTYRTFATSSLYHAQGYGDGKGNPVQDDPQSQPPTSDLQQASEHPGPSPPDVGQKASSGPTKAGLNKSMKKAAARESGQKKTPEDASAQSGGSRSKEATETGGSPTGGSIADAASQSGGEALKGPQGKGTPSPKIHNLAMPAVKSGLSDEQKQEVERHNADFEKRHDRAAPASDDKVDSKFWKGT
ncbi:hypothetical protein F4781DRAFT_64126 [Annulohypoxylon bovei var. microspora]|nr:hypothetical protein F4781DRAFT_64126 [Annulohypoxylon bovei var. microspora]